MENILKFEQQEAFDELINSIKKLADVVMEVWQKIIEAIKTIFNTFWNALKEFLKQVNPKVYHLAYYHPKYRVRKKNQARLLRIWRRLIKNG